MIRKAMNVCDLILEIYGVKFVLSTQECGLLAVLFVLMIFFELYYQTLCMLGDFFL